MITTIESYNGEKEHIIIEDADDDEVKVACGHTHFDITELSTRKYTVAEIFHSDSVREHLCGNCINRIEDVEDDEVSEVEKLAEEYTMPLKREVNKKDKGETPK